MEKLTEGVQQKTKEVEERINELEKRSFHIMKFEEQKGKIILINKNVNKA